MQKLPHLSPFKCHPLCRNRLEMENQTIRLISLIHRLRPFFLKAHYYIHDPRTMLEKD